MGAQQPTRSGIRARTALNGPVATPLECRHVDAFAQAPFAGNR